MSHEFYPHNFEDGKPIVTDHTHPTKPGCDARLADHSRRLDEHDVKIERHEQRLSLGDVGFAEVRKDIQAMTMAITNLANRVELAIAANQVNWSQEAGKACVFWIVPLVGGGLLWSIVHSGAVK
jgi:hypothetical protein